MIVEMSVERTEALSDEGQMSVVSKGWLRKQVER
jgi:hypothetical protein